MKRKAEHALERDDFLRDDDEDTAPRTTQSTGQGNIASAEQIAQRRIVKLKIPGQSGGEQPELSATAKFELAGALDQPKSGTTDNGSTNKTPSFLANLPATNTTPSTGGLFANLIKPTEGGEEKKTGGLFSGLFNKDNNQSATSGLFTTSQTGSGGLFGSIFGGNTGGGLASLAKKDYTYVHKETGEKPAEGEEKKEGGAGAAAKPQATKPSLFASLADFKPGPNLFSSTASSGLFSSSLTGGAGALGGSLFGGKKDDDLSDDGGEDGDDEPQRSPSPEADVTKSKGNYQYQRDYEKVIGKKVNKFKPGTKTMLLEGEASLNKRENGSYFLVYRNKAKLNQYQGEIVAKVSKTEYLNARQDALSVVAFSTETPVAEEGKEAPKDAKPKINRDIVKLMFATADDCNEFKKEIDNVVA